MESGLDYFIREYAGARKVNVNETIYADDEMYSFLATRQGAPLAKMNYFRMGSELTRTIMQIANWRFAGKTDQIKLMEFACGYGRNLRHIVNCIAVQNIVKRDRPNDWGRPERVRPDPLHRGGREELKAGPIVRQVKIP